MTLWQWLATPIFIPQIQHAAIAVLQPLYRLSSGRLADLWNYIANTVKLEAPVSCLRMSVHADRRLQDRLLLNDTSAAGLGKFQ